MTTTESGLRQERALATLNRNRGEGRHTTPTGDDGHYPGWYKWDGDFAAIVRARFGDPDGARQELLVEAESVESNGFIPNMVTRGSHRWWDLEPKTFSDPNKSSYSQPPVFALAAMETYSSFISLGREVEGKSFLEEIYPSVAKHFRYFMTYREMGDKNPLIFVIHPHETGRDYDPTFDETFGGFRLPVTWKDRRVVALDQARRFVNAVSAYGHRLWMGYELRRHGWTEEAGKKYCGVQDVMFNAIYAHGLDTLSGIADIVGKKEEASEFKTKGQQVSQAIFERMWDAEDEVFKALDRNGERINTVSVSNLFPLILGDIGQVQMESVLGMLEDPDAFGVSFPIPSLPMRDPKFDAYYEAPLIWRGTTWPPMNFYLVDQGLNPRAQEQENKNPVLAQRLYTSSLRISEASARMADDGYSEQKNPLTGRHVRERTAQNFSWGTLLELLAVKRDAIKRRLRALVLH